MTELFHHIERFATLTEGDKEQLALLLNYRDVHKKEVLLKEGKTCTTNYFIIKGCLRMYYVNNKGVEQIVQFGIDNWWMTDYLSYIHHKPSLFYIQALETSSLICWEREKEDELFKLVPAMERYFRRILQHSAGAAQQRSRYLSDFTGEERYYHFSNSFPEFLQRVPQYMLASYLGFTPEFLSKIRARKV